MQRKEAMMIRKPGQSTKADLADLLRVSRSEQHRQCLHNDNNHGLAISAGVYSLTYGRPMPVSGQHARDGKSPTLAERDGDPACFLSLLRICLLHACTRVYVLYLQLNSMPDSWISSSSSLPALAPSILVLLLQCL